MSEFQVNQLRVYVYDVLKSEVPYFRILGIKDKTIEQFNDSRDIVTRSGFILGNRSEQPEERDIASISFI